MGAALLFTVGSPPSNFRYFNVGIVFLDAEVLPFTPSSGGRS